MNLGQEVLNERLNYDPGLPFGLARKDASIIVIQIIESFVQNLLLQARRLIEMSFHSVEWKHCG